MNVDGFSKVFTALPLNVAGHKRQHNANHFRGNCDSNQSQDNKMWERCMS